MLNELAFAHDFSVCLFTAAVCYVYSEWFSILLSVVSSKFGFFLNYCAQNGLDLGTCIDCSMRFTSSNRPYMSLAIGN